MLPFPPLLFELVCGLEVRYCLIGDNDWTHTLRCDFLLAEIGPRRGRSTALPFELALQRETASGQECEEGWPRIRSEMMFILNLVTFSSDPWHIYALHAELEQPFPYNVIAKSKLDAEAMREAEVQRLEGAFALRLFKKITEPAVDPKFKTGKRKRAWSWSWPWRRRWGHGLCPERCGRGAFVSGGSFGGSARRRTRASPRSQGQTRSNWLSVGEGRVDIGSAQRQG